MCGIDLWTLLSGRFRFSRSGMGPEVLCLFDKLPSDADAAGSQALLRAAKSKLDTQKKMSTQRASFRIGD